MSADSERLLPAEPSSVCDKELDALDFLRLVLPQNGWFAAGIMGYKRMQATQWFDSHEGLATYLLDQGLRADAYYATAAFAKDTTRKGANVLAKRALYVDLDVVKPDDPSGQATRYASLEAAEAAMPVIRAAVGLSPTILVYSGGGLHLYWTLDDDLSVEEWQSLADELKLRLTDAGISFDVGITGDPVRLMRLPGTQNHKPHLRRPMVRARQVGEVISVEEARTILAARERSRSREPRMANKSATDDDTYWQRTRVALLRLPDEALLQWLDGLLEHANPGRWDDYDSWVQIVLACKPIADARESLCEPVLDLLVKYSARSSHSMEDVRADIERHCASANGKASLLSTMKEAEANGWVNTLIDPQGRYLSKEAFVDYISAEHVYVKDLDAWVCVSDGKLVSMRAISVSEQSLAPLGENGRPVSVEGLLRNDPRIRRVKRLRYAPGLPMVFSDNDGQKVVNTYRFVPPVPLMPTQEELDLWNEVLDWALPTGDPDCCVFRQWFLDGLAWLVQAERRRLPFAMLLFGGYGYGKTTLMRDVPQILLGNGNVASVSQGELESSFNDWSANLRVLVIDEMSMGSSRDARRLANKLKPIITGDQLHVHPKGFKGYEQPNTVSILATSNEDDAAYLDDGDRRWLVCRSPSAAMSKELGTRFHTWLEGDRGAGVLRGIFLSRDVSKFNPHAPPPMTESKREMTLRSRSPIAQALVDLFERREPPFDQPIIATEDVVQALEEEGFQPYEYSAQGIARVLKAPPIRATRLKGKKRVQLRGSASSLASITFQPKRVYVAQRDNPELWECVSEALLRRQRERPWNPTAEPHEFSGRQGEG